jgi:GNAT superfamily N-acetyltransferase
MTRAGCDYLIRPAEPGDVEAIMGLLDDATLWLHARGLDQWQAGRARREMFVRSDVELGTVAVVEDADGRIVATITVDDMADADFWKKRDRVHKALYLHRMAVSRTSAGIGLGAAMLDWAGLEAKRRGRKLLRLDAWATNEGLHAYYRGQGFTNVRTEHVHGRGSGALFARSARVRTGAGPVLVDARLAQPAVGVEMP